VLLASACREGQGIEVEKLEFTGLNAVTRDQLEEALVTQASSAWPLGQRRLFDPAEFEADLKRIVTFYQDRGFPDARIVSVDVALNRAQDAVSIGIEVAEGEPILVEDVRFSGFEVLPAQEFAAFVERAPLEAGKPFDRLMAQSLRETALDELRNQGYPYADVELDVRDGAAPRTRVVSYSATPGLLAHFGPVEVVGNASVSDEVITRQLTFRPGYRFSLDRIRESQRRLYGLELFQFANVQVVDPEAPAPEVPTRVTVAEGKHRRFEFGVGYGTEEKFRGEARWRHVNFFGGARTAGIEGKWSSLDQGVRVNFLQPYVFSPHYSFNLAGHRWYGNEPAYELLRSGGRATLTRQFTSGRPPQLTNTRASLTYSYEIEDYAISREALEDLSFRDTLIALGLDPRTGTGGGTLSAVSFDLHRTNVANTLDPAAGYAASLHVERAGHWLSGDFDYTELTIEGRHYAPMGPALLLASRLKAGTIAGPEPIESAVPFFKRYFLGGATSLRGWGRFQVSPLSLSGLPIGGHSQLEASAEVRARLGGRLGAVLFVDAGNVWPGSWDIRPQDLLVDVGPGLRYFTPIGPIRFDFAYQLTPIEGLFVEGKLQTRRWRMHFSIGQAF
jgi:outer membrane protein insertion porin family/translocation and assembly module TamA